MARTIAVLSGKGGTGKTFLCSALGASLVSDFKKRVLLVDCNFSSPSLGVFLNIVRPAATLYSVLAEGAQMGAAVFAHDTGLHVVPSSLSIGKDASPDNLQAALSQVVAGYDFILLDCAGTMTQAEISVARAAGEAFIATTPEIPAVTGALKLIGTLQSAGVPVTGVILNRFKGRGEKHELRAEEIESATKSRVLVTIPEDLVVRESTFARTPATLYNPASPSSVAVRALAADILGLPHPQKPSIFGSLLGGKRRPEARSASTKISLQLEGVRAGVMFPAAPQTQQPAAAAAPQPAQAFTIQPAVQAQRQQQAPSAAAPEQQPQPQQRRTKDDYMKAWMDGKMTLDEMMEKIAQLEKGA